MVDVSNAPLSIRLRNLELTGKALDQPGRVGRAALMNANVEENLMHRFMLDDKPVESPNEMITPRTVDGERL